MNKLLLVFLLVFTFFSCKKGENDPDFSFRSRKARLTGNWQLTEALITYDDTTYAFDGKQVIITYDTISTDTLGYELAYTFDGNGNFSKTISLTYNKNTINEITATEETSGFWNFTGGAGDTKTKSQLQLQVTSYDYNSSDEQSRVIAENYIGNPEATIYNIDRLAKDELVLKIDYTYQFPGGSDNRVEEWKFKKQ